MTAHVAGKTQLFRRFVHRQHYRERDDIAEEVILIILDELS